MRISIAPLLRIASIYDILFGHQDNCSGQSFTALLAAGRHQLRLGTSERAWCLDSLVISSGGRLPRVSSASEHISTEGRRLMIVREVIMFEIKPGRYDEFVSQARELKGVLERIDVGLTSVRLSSALVGGTNSGRISMSFEHDNITSWAASMRNEFNDSSLTALATEWFGPNAPATMVNRVLLREIEL